MTIFYDGGGLDYITEMRSPNGLIIDPWEWPTGAPGGNLLRNWRGVGHLARLKALAEERKTRVIDCTVLDPRGEIPVTDDERDSILSGGAEIVAGYLDWDAFRILRIPSAPGGDRP